MFGNMLFLQLLFLGCLVALTSADHGGPHHEEHPPRPCQTDKDCGDQANCDRSSGACTCPGVPGKSYIDIPEASPRCQKTSVVSGSCKYDKQCSFTSGNLTRCYKDKCECYDTFNNGRDRVRHFEGTCYLTTTVNETCYDDNQCKASIKPEEHIRCVHDGSRERRGVCKCDQGQKCEEKPYNGAGVIGGTIHIVTLTLAGIMATKVFL